jgi:ProP effector
MPDRSRSTPDMPEMPTAPEEAAPEPTPQTPPAGLPGPEAVPATDVAAHPSETETTSMPVQEAASMTPVTTVTPAPVELSPAACAARLAELFPALFGAGRALPIKLRIQSDIQQRAPGIFTRKSLSPFLHRYTTSTAYLKALVHAPHRFDLDGAPAGDIDEVHRQAAAAELERRRSLFEARREAERAAANEARRRAEAEARQQHAADEAARRERAALLRAYESSTLTRANFCALKGIPESELDGRLHQAWLEREQRALEMRPPPERGPRPRDERRPTEAGLPERPQGHGAPRPGGRPAGGGGPRPERGNPPRPRGAAPPKPAR